MEKTLGHMWPRKGLGARDSEGDWANSGTCHKKDMISQILPSACAEDGPLIRTLLP